MSFFHTTARFRKLLENGVVKTTTEHYLIDAISCTEAEARTIKELTPFVAQGDVRVSSCKCTPISESFGQDDADRFYLAKVAFITFDERSGAEKRKLSQIIIGATDFNKALSIFKNEMKSTVADYELTALIETPYLEIFPFCESTPTTK
ncbi:MAG: DUF4494 domain-containing protein [Muribaculaceae bacterium]|nr:DUF4494 domain-containing protein [Muribaculaceae bacterium]